MKLNELENLRMERAQSLTDRVNALMTHAEKRAGTEEARADSVEMLRLTCDAWDANDEMSVYIEAVKAQINIPSLGMSVSDAELWLHGLQHKQAFLEAVVESVGKNQPEPEVSEDSGEPLPSTCPKCGGDWSPSIDMELVSTLLAEVRAEITRLASAIERAVCSIETTWQDRAPVQTPSLPVQPPQQAGMQVIGEVVIPTSDLQQAVSSMFQPPQPQPQPQQVVQPQVAQPQQVVQSFQVVDPSCPVCVSPGRLALERHWLATKGDTVSTLELGLMHGVIPQNMSPQLMQMHFDDHAKASDHGLVA